MLALLFSACGPENEPDASTETATSIALAYQANRNMTEAQSQLQALELPNANQWLIYTTESLIADRPDATETNALAMMVLDMGLRSNVVTAYAQATGLQSGSLTSSNPTAGESAIVNSANATGNTVNNSVDNSDVSNSLSNVIVPMPESAAQSVTSSAAGENSGNEVVDTANDTAAADDTAANDTASEESSETGANAVAATATPAVEIASEPAPTQDTRPFIVAASGINVRTGPGTEYAVAGALTAGETSQIAGKNGTGDWWEIILPSGQQGWVYGPLVNTTGDVNAVAVAVNIPTPPPTAVPQPTAVPLPTAEPEAPTPEPAPIAAGPDFRVTQKRLWDVVENGGRLDGPSVTCGEKRQLVVNVVDAAGNGLNGVAVQAIYGAQEIFVTGNQGKGDAKVEFVLGGGQAVKVIRDVDGREVSSEEAHGLSTKPWEIPFETLIGGRFCTDAASCQSFVDATGCYGHYSWEVTFQRNY